MVDAMARALRAEPAIFALIVDAKDVDALRFYLHHGFQRFTSRLRPAAHTSSSAARRLGAT
jgi:hypothetical protein